MIFTIRTVVMIYNHGWWIVASGASGWWEIDQRARLREGFESVKVSIAWSCVDRLLTLCTRCWEHYIYELVIERRYMRNYRFIEINLVFSFVSGGKRGADKSKEHAKMHVILRLALP